MSWTSPNEGSWFESPTWLRLTDGDGKEQCLMDCVQILLIDKAFSMSFRRVGFANKICFCWPYL